VKGKLSPRTSVRGTRKFVPPAVPIHGRVTLRTLASHLGCSVTTVSRALKNGPEVHKATIVRVEEAARALGYRPHVAGTNLRTGRTQAVGLLLPLERPGEINNLSSWLLEGVSAHLTALNYRTIVVPVMRGEQSLESVKEVVASRSVDGIVLKFLLEARFPFVTFGRTELLSDHPYFDVDHEAVGTDAANLLLDAGHLEPVLVAPPQELMYSRLLLRGWERACTGRGRAPDKSQIFFSAVAPKSGQQIASQLIEQRSTSTAAFVASEEAALGFVAGLNEAGLRVGRNFGVVTYGGSQLHRFIIPPLSVFHFSQFDTGERLADLLLRSIAGENPKALQEVAPGDFVDYGSQLLRPN
jgi:LacI family transcriptional regulator, galactose operon repressor